MGPGVSRRRRRGCTAAASRGLRRSL